MSDHPLAADPMLSGREAAAYLGLKPGTLANFRSQRRGPPFHKICGAVRYSLADLEAFKAASRRGGNHGAAEKDLAADPQT